MDELINLASTVENFRKNNCNKCYHGTILEAWYDNEGALQYLEKHDKTPPIGITRQAFAYTADVLAKQNGEEGFWRVRQTTCPYKYCKVD